ncbi:Phosphatidylglycerophosphate synthase [Planctomycetales bacterium 10988]|nr:Phosphatidylglycerophosphate synthase [Planctomycetales bacterium 10988]
MESTTSPPPARPTLSKEIWTLPNKITFARFLLSLVVFALLEPGWYLAAAICFIIAAGTDWLDGYYARKYQLVSVVGRILDPFVDKLLVCGTFIYLGAIAESGVTAWMVVAIVAREMLVTVIRSFLEQHGADFSAKFWGKAKMLLQSIAIPWCLFGLSLVHSYSDETAPSWTEAFLWGRTIVVWLTVLITIYSGWLYVQMAYRWLQVTPEISDEKESD